MTSWVDVPEDSPFPLQNLPYGVFSHGGEAPRVGVALGNHVIDLAPLAGAAGLDGGHVFQSPSLNPFLALGRPAWGAVRSWLSELLAHPGERGLVEGHLLPRADVAMHLPFEVADYVDFYSSQHHAENVGRIFRPDSEPLTPNWKHLPIGYHGRAGTVVVSGTNVVRPSGQRKRPTDAAPSYGPSARLDIEAEVGFVVGTPSRAGRPVPTGAFRDHVFGVCLVNDWSARDIQAWEYVPLGPFLGKSFATSVSAWVVPLDALDAARVQPPPQDPEVLPYLRDEEPWGLDLSLEVRWNGTLVSRPPFAGMYWTPAQQLAHLTANGASLRTGDLYASGTVSGPEPGQRGSFLELAWNGEQPVTLDDGSTRTFLEDGDEVTITAWAPGAGGARIGFGEVAGRVVPATT
ncbi:MAG: fumarylacetoacetase [Actinomycetes bacterium]